ncbi:ATP-binding protein [Salinibius halmophilus]|uniref:ATP-binding protein n=1 Tax=Salinibius halmophilus TaxID=1853216 RepID=UPI000E673070|nr:ATP-binding protein [Salinibius halmophilus]
MRELFFRSYITILVTLLITVSLVLGGVQAFNNYRFGKLANNMLAGPMMILAQGYANTPESSRPLFAEQMRLIMPVPLTFSQSEQTDGVSITHNWQQDNAVAVARYKGYSVAAEVNGFDQLAAKLSVLLIINDISQVPTSMREQRFSELQALMHYPLQLQDVASLELDASEKFELSRNKVLTRQTNNGDNRSTQAIATPTDRTALIYGPIPTFVAVPLELALLMVLVVILVTALGTWPALLPLQKRLQRMADSVGEIDRGDMDHRLPVEKADALDDMAVAINGLADRLIGALDAQRTLVHAVSHELKTPLARMQFRLATIEGQVADKTYDGLERDLQSLSQLVNELLEYGKDHPTHAPLTPETVELHQLVKVTWQAQHHNDSSVEFINQVPKPTYIELDRNLASKLLSNLFSNALRFCHSKVAVDFDESTMLLSVSDDGPGIPEKQRAQVLQPFFRLDPSRQRGTGGHGLGLSIAHRIALWHHGDLWFETSQWQGAKAVWLLPESLEGSA